MHKAFISEVKFPSNYTLTKLNLFIICTITAKQIKAMVKNFVGDGAQPCVPRWRTTILTAFFRLISQCPGKVAAWYDHPKSLCGHYVARFNPDQDLGLFGPKQHRPHCLSYSTLLTYSVNYSMFTSLLLARKTCWTSTVVFHENQRWWL